MAGDWDIKPKTNKQNKMGSRGQSFLYSMVPNESKENEKHLKFHNDVLRDNKYRNWFCVNFIEMEVPKRVPGVSRNETNHCRII